MSGTKCRKLPTSADVSEHQKVQRYYHDAYADPDNPMVAENNGGWVLYSDYEALAARVQELENGTAYKLAGAVAAQINQKNEELQAENQRLREALAEYGHHKGGCDFDPCSCGILAALKETP